MTSSKPANYSTFAYAYHGQVIAAGAVFPAVAIIIVGLRFWTRWTKKVAFGADDWLIIPALLGIIGMGACLIAGAEKHVMGYPTPAIPGSNAQDQATDLPPGQATLELIEWVFLRLMVLAYGFIKLSVIFFYRRIFVTRKWSTFDIVTKVSTLIIVLWTIAFFLVNVFGCGKHFDYGWGPLVEEEHCADGLKELEALMISDFVTDLLVLLLPFPIIWRLNMTTTRKLAVTGILLLGASSLGASIARMVLQIQLAIYGYTTKTDIFLTITTILHWSMIEAGLAIIASCLPALQALFVKGSLQSMVASIRSMISLQSIRSHSSRGSKSSRQGQPPYAEIYGIENGAEDTVALKDIDGDPSLRKPESVHPESRAARYNSNDSMV